MFFPKKKKEKKVRICSILYFLKIENQMEEDGMQKINK
jgi:hypothetical protein